MDRQGFKTFCRTRLTSETLDNDDKRTLTSFFAIHLLLLFFFTKTNEGKMEVSSRQTYCPIFKIL